MSAPPVFDLVIPLIGFKRSGGERLVIHVANELAARGRRVAFVVPDHAATPPIDLAQGIEIITRGDARGFRDRMEFVRSLPDARVYLATGYQTPVLIAWARRLARKDARIVHLIQADEAVTHILYGAQPDRLKPLLRVLASRGLAVPATRIAVSSAVADAVGRERIHRIINPGIEARYRERARESAPAPRARRHDATDRVTIGFFAQAGRVKGTAVALEALQRMAPSASLRFIAFDRADGPRLPEFVEKFSVWQGGRPLDPLAFYNICDVFLFPSLVEGFGLPPLEAMACGAATVISDCGGVGEYARHEENCLLVPPGDAEALAAAAERLAGDMALRSWVTVMGRETAQRFPVERFAGECADEIERAMGAP